VLAKKDSRSIALRLIPNQQKKHVDFEIIQNAKARDIGEGTVRRGSATCPMCGFTTPVASVRGQLKERRGGAINARLFCVVTTHANEDNNILDAPSKSCEDRVREQVVGARPTGYRMIESFTVDRFRCFEHVELRDLRRINVIVGQNGAGKTALGEAIYLTAAAAPHAAWFVRLARNRPLPQQPVFWDQQFFKSFWQDLFYNFDDRHPIASSLTDSLQGKYSVHVSYDQARSAPMPTSANLSISPIPPLVFERIDPHGEKRYTIVRVNDKGQPEYEGNLELIPKAAIVPSTYPFSQSDVVNWYSNLSKAGQEDSVVEALTKAFPQIDGVSIEIDATLATLFVHQKSVIQRMPLAIVSSGIAKFLNILLAIASVHQGIVLVDEIENGLYYKKMPQVWETLLAMCRKYEVQLFAATHSWECLKALLPSLSPNKEEFCLLRTERENDRTVVKSFSGIDLEAALEEEFEVR
jgi:ABC-type dipeptide/oligopeptide/nickel transport system ATPase subunit